MNRNLEAGGNHSGIEEQFLSFDWVGEESCEPLVGQQVVDVQVGGSGADAFPILHWCFDLGREGGGIFFCHS